jgi:hypothetical protein
VRDLINKVEDLMVGYNSRQILQKA